MAPGSAATRRDDPPTWGYTFPPGYDGPFVASGAEAALVPMDELRRWRSRIERVWNDGQQHVGVEVMRDVLRRICGEVPRRKDVTDGT